MKLPFVGRVWPTDHMLAPPGLVATLLVTVALNSQPECFEKFAGVSSIDI